MEEINIENFKKEGFSFEEIESIKKGLDDLENGRILSKEEMDNFIKTELFSKYTVNV